MRNGIKKGIIGEVALNKVLKINKGVQTASGRHRSVEQHGDFKEMHAIHYKEQKVQWGLSKK